MSDILVITTVSDEDVAQEFLSGLLEDGLVRSGSILPKKTMYYWEKQLTIDDEFLIIMKSGESDYPSIEKYVEKHHPFLVPEVIKIPASFGSEAFRQFVRNKKKSG